MSIATVEFDASLWRPDATGRMRGHVRSPREGVVSVDPVSKTVFVHIGGRRLLFLYESDILSANVEAWDVGVTWAPSYWRAGYGADEKPWGDIPIEKRA